jgi:hypothetical protein
MLDYDYIMDARENNRELELRLSYGRSSALPPASLLRAGPTARIIV